MRVGVAHTPLPLQVVLRADQQLTSLAPQVRDAGNLLARAGLSIPSVDVDEIIVHYSNPEALVDHLRLDTCLTPTEAPYLLAPGSRAVKPLALSPNND